MPPAPHLSFFYGHIEGNTIENFCELVPLLTGPGGKVAPSDTIWIYTIVQEVIGGKKIPVCEPLCKSVRPQIKFVLIIALNFSTRLFRLYSVKDLANAWQVAGYLEIDRRYAQASGRVRYYREFMILLLDEAAMGQAARGG